MCRVFGVGVAGRLGKLLPGDYGESKALAENT